MASLESVFWATLLLSFGLYFLLSGALVVTLRLAEFREPRFRALSLPYALRYLLVSVGSALLAMLFFDRFGGEGTAAALIAIGLALIVGGAILLWLDLRATRKKL